MALAQQEATVREVYMTVTETAEFYRVSSVTVWRLIREGKLKRFKLGRRTLIRQSDAEALIQE
jgi:excisionase family DNA binding protein